MKILEDETTFKRFTFNIYLLYSDVSETNFWVLKMNRVNREKGSDLQESKYIKMFLTCELSVACSGFLSSRILKKRGNRSDIPLTGST